MIVLTVGTQLPFDRLIQMMDELAPELDQPIFAQIGITTYEMKNAEAHSNISPIEFEKAIKEASVIVAHAGIGTVLKAYKYGKPIILVPRLASLGEHRNDHQLATVSQLRKRVGIYVANDKDELRTLLNSRLEPAVMTADNEQKRLKLIGFLREQIQDTDTAKPRARLVSGP